MGEHDEVPKLPRSLGFRLPPAALARIALTAVLLVFVIIAQRPCADAVSGFVTGFDQVGSGSSESKLPRPGTVDLPPTATGSAGDYESLRPDMTEAEMKAAIERARQKAK